jgi:glyoxylase I family protein
MRIYACNAVGVGIAPPGALTSKNAAKGRGVSPGGECGADYGRGMELRRIHHVAIIAADYRRSRTFYTEVLGLRVLAEHYRAERDSYKLDLALPDGTQLELFSFPDPPARPTRPEARGLRHLAFAVADVAAALAELRARGVPTEEVRVDEYTGKRFGFFADPDGLPLELYEE